MKLLDAIERAKAERNFSHMAECIPFARFLDLRVSFDEDRLLFAMSFKRELVGNPTLPALHGGIIGSLLETAAQMQVIWDLEQTRVPKTITTTIDYLRSGRPLETFAQSEITKMGRRVVNVRTLAWQDDRTKPIASANAHFLID